MLPSVTLKNQMSKNFPPKCLRNVFCGLLFVLSRRFGDSYGRAGDLDCIQRELT